MYETIVYMRHCMQEHLVSRERAHFQCKAEVVADRRDAGHPADGLLVLPLILFYRAKLGSRGQIIINMEYCAWFVGLVLSTSNSVVFSYYNNLQQLISKDKSNPRLFLVGFQEARVRVPLRYIFLYVF